MGMTFDEARAQIVNAIQLASAAGDDARFATALADPARDIAFDTLNFDSLAAMEMCIAIEDATAVEIDLGDLLAFPSVNRLSEFLVRRASAQ